MCRWAVQLLDAFDVFPFLYIPGFYQIQFTAEPLLLCHFHWLEGGCLKEETSSVNCASRELQEQMWSEEISEHQFPDKNSLVVQGAVPASGADPIPWPGCLVGRIPGICCIQGCSDAASMLPQLFIPLLSLNLFSFLFGLRMSQEKIAFFPSCQSKKPQGCSIFCYIYIIYKYI